MQKPQSYATTLFLPFTLPCYTQSTTYLTGMQPGRRPFEYTSLLRYAIANEKVGEVTTPPTLTLKRADATRRPPVSCISWRAPWPNARLNPNRSPPSPYSSFFGSWPPPSLPPLSLRPQAGTVKMVCAPDAVPSTSHSRRGPPPAANT